MSSTSRVHPLSFALAVLVLTPACAEDPPAPRPPRPAADVPEEEDENWDEHFSALGYTDFADDEEPGDEPEGPVLIDPERAAPGYTLVTSIPHSAADLVALDGSVVHTWSNPEAGNWDRAELDETGRLIVIEFPVREDGGTHTAFEDVWYSCYDWDSTLLWRVPIPAHHDFDIRPDGSSVVLGRQPFEPREGVVIADDTAVFVSADGKIERSVSMLDALLTKKALANRLRKRMKGLSPAAKPHDILHANSVTWNPYPELVGTSPIHRPEAVLVSLRARNGVFALDIEANEVLWSWGAEDLLAPHEATWLPDGKVLVFDNGLESRPWSRVVEIDPTTDEITWEWRADPETDFYCQARGTSQWLEGGNVLVADSDSGVAFEVTRSGDVVWRYANHRKTEGRRGTLRAKRYALDLVEPFLESSR